MSASCVHSTGQDAKGVQVSGRGINRAQSCSQGPETASWESMLCISVKVKASGSVYMYVCVCVYIHVYTMCIDLCEELGVWRDMCECVYVCAYVFLRVHICVCM